MDFKSIMWLFDAIVLLFLIYMTAPPSARLPGRKLMDRIPERAYYPLLQSSVVYGGILIAVRFAVIIYAYFLFSNIAIALFIAVFTLMRVSIHAVIIILAVQAMKKLRS